MTRISDIIIVTFHTNSDNTHCVYNIKILCSKKPKQYSFFKKKEIGTIIINNLILNNRSFIQPPIISILIRLK